MAVMTGSDVFWNRSCHFCDTQLSQNCKGQKFAQLVEEGSEEELGGSGSSGWTQHFSERVAARTSVWSSLSSTSSSTSNSSTYLSMSRGFSSWQQMSSRYEPAVDLRRPSDVQHRTISRNSLEKDWSFDRLRLALRTLVQVISTQLTVFLCIDDIRWADQQSLTMLKTILSNN